MQEMRRCEFDFWVGKIPWRRKWQPTSVFLPKKPQGESSLVDYDPWGLKRVGQDWSDLACVCVRARTHTHTHTHFIAVTTLSLSVGLSDGSHDQMQVVYVWQEYPRSNVSSSVPHIRRPTKAHFVLIPSVFTWMAWLRSYSLLSKAFVIAKKLFTS